MTKKDEKERKREEGSCGDDLFLENQVVGETWVSMTSLFTKNAPFEHRL